MASDLILILISFLFWFDSIWIDILYLFNLNLVFYVSHMRLTNGLNKAITYLLTYSLTPSTDIDDKISDTKYIVTVDAKINALMFRF